MMPSNNYTTQIKVEMVCHGTLNPEVRQRKHRSGQVCFCFCLVDSWFSQNR